MKKILFIFLMAFFGLSLIILETGCPAGNSNICELPAPGSLAATPVSNTAVKLTWNTVEGAANYNAKIYAVNGDNLTLEQVETHANSGITFNGLSPNALYEAVVRSNCANDISSNDSSVVQFRLGIIPIEDVVMIEGLKKEEIMPGMNDQLCNNTEDIGLKSIDKNTNWRVPWAENQVHELIIKDSHNNDVTIKIGNDTGSVQCSSISSSGSDSLRIQVSTMSTTNQKYISIIRSSSGQDIGKIVFDTGGYTISNLELVVMNVAQKKCDN